MKLDNIFVDAYLTFVLLFLNVYFQVLNNIDRTVISKVQPMEQKIFYTNITTKWIHQIRLSADHHCMYVKRRHFHWSRRIGAMSLLPLQIHRIDIVPVVCCNLYMSEFSFLSLPFPYTGIICVEFFTVKIEK